MSGVADGILSDVVACASAGGASPLRGAAASGGDVISAILDALVRMEKRQVQLEQTVRGLQVAMASRFGGEGAMDVDPSGANKVERMPTGMKKLVSELYDEPTKVRPSPSSHALLPASDLLASVPEIPRAEDMTQVSRTLTGMDVLSAARTASGSPDDRTAPLASHSSAGGPLFPHDPGAVLPGVGHPLQFTDSLSCSDMRPSHVTPAPTSTDRAMDRALEQAMVERTFQTVDTAPATCDTIATASWRSTDGERGRRRESSVNMGSFRAAGSPPRSLSERLGSGGRPGRLHESPSRAGRPRRSPNLGARSPPGASGRSLGSAVFSALPDAASQSQSQSQSRSQLSHSGQLAFPEC